VTSYALDWLNLIVRWLHFVAGISWIGASFYFVWLDDNLSLPSKEEDRNNGVTGELWSVHGGGFYHNQKYLTGPKTERLPDKLHWFKWEAYTTWISGVALLALVYWVGAGVYLVDKSVLDISPGAAVAISAASLFLGWLVYDGLCKLISNRPLLLGIAVYVFLTVVAWALFHVFGARAAFLHVGAIIGTIMVANVAHVIIPGQRKMLADIRAGRAVDTRPGIAAKTRSVHNTYLTLPVLFTMISGHYPMTYNSPYGWLVLAVIGLASVLVRYFFILTHRRRMVWVLPATAAVLLATVALALAPRVGKPTAVQVNFAAVQPIFARRCAVCHAATPTQPGFTSAPAGVLLDSPQHIAANARRAYQQAVLTHAMPLGNLTGMTAAERATLGAWFDAGAPAP